MAKTKPTGKKKSLVPKKSRISKLEDVEIQRALKKPNGKGYSIGTVGEEIVITNSPQSHFDEVPDLISPDGKIISDSPKQRQKKGHSKLGAKSVAAKKSEKHR